MPLKWTVEFYEDEDGNAPVQDYIMEGNDEQRIATCINVIRYLMEHGRGIRDTDMDKGLNDSIRELRKDRHRILYGQIGTRFFLLSAFMKRTQKTPPEEIELAERRLAECQKRPLIKPLRF